MKNATRLLFVSAGLLPLALRAQITIGADDMPSAGDTMRYRTTTIANFDGSDTGPGHVWDFHDIAIQAEGADTAVSVGSTPFLYQIFFNNPILFPDTRATYALRGQSFNVQAISLQDVYDYYKVDGDGFRNVGFGATINAVPASVQRQPVDWIYRFPLDHGNVDSSYSTYTFNVPTLFTYGQQQMRRNEVDGWGTLYLPADTFQVLRVVSHLERVDTLYIEQFGFGFTLPEPETIEYKWIALGMDQPVLQVTTVGGIPLVQRFYYQPEDFSTGIATVPTATAPDAWPNPANGVLHVRAQGTAPLELVDAGGRVVRTIAANGQRERTMDVSGLSPGAYVLRTQGSAGGTRVVVH